MGWDGKGGFCSWVSNLAEAKVTLPTEHQYEYACRGGVNGFEYPWGNYFSNTKLWCSKVKVGDARMSASVLRTNNFFTNSFGLSDMVGNVWQWCSSWLEPYTVGDEPTTISTKRVATGLRVVRGGSWVYKDVGFFRCANRGSCDPSGRHHNNGFRLVSEFK
jgi:sulfatase modifying factor 1